MSTAVGISGYSSEGERTWRELWPVAALTLVAAVFRFSTLATQHFWIDESVTVGLVQLDLPTMLGTIPDKESTPPLYYVLAWFWGKLFGTDEFGLRSVSALVGTAVVPVAYVAARQFVARRAALLAAALAALSPVLIWYSQEARAYSLLVFLCAVSLALFGRALTAPTPAVLVAWSATAVLALATHYFAAVVVAAEAGWLLLRPGARVRVALACAPIALTALALAPLALHQRDQGHLDFLALTGLGRRTGEAAKVFVTGTSGLRLGNAAWLGIAIAVLGLGLLALRGDAEEHRRVTPLAAVAAASLVAPLVLAAVGADYVLARNLLPVWLPIAILVAAGMTVHHAGKLGVAAAAALCVFFAAVSVAVPLVAKLRRESITAQLLNVPGQKATVDIAFARVPAGGRRALSVRCPGGYRAQRALVGWLGDAPRGARLMSRRGRPALTSWMATGVASPDRAATYQLAVICGPAAG